MPVVKEYVDVFPKDLFGLVPECDFSIAIKLLPETCPISKAPYQMAHAELEELQSQVKSSWIRDLFALVFRHGEHPFYLSRRRMVHSACVSTTESSIR